MALELLMVDFGDIDDYGEEEEQSRLFDSSTNYCCLESSIACIWCDYPPLLHQVTATAVLSRPPTLYTGGSDGSIIRWSSSSNLLSKQHFWSFPVMALELLIADYGEEEEEEEEEDEQQGNMLEIVVYEDNTALEVPEVMTNEIEGRKTISAEFVMQRELDCNKEMPGYDFEEFPVPVQGEPSNREVWEIDGSTPSDSFSNTQGETSDSIVFAKKIMKDESRDKTDIVGMANESVKRNIMPMELAIQGMQLQPRYDLVELSMRVQEEPSNLELREIDRRSSSDSSLNTQGEMSDLKVPVKKIIKEDVRDAMDIEMANESVKGNIMPVEPAIQRELAYQKKIEGMQLQASYDFVELPVADQEMHSIRKPSEMNAIPHSGKFPCFKGNMLETVVFEENSALEEVPEEITDGIEERKTISVEFYMQREIDYCKKIGEMKELPGYDLKELSTPVQGEPSNLELWKIDRRTPSDIYSNPQGEMSDSIVLVKKIVKEEPLSNALKPAVVLGNEEENSSPDCVRKIYRARLAVRQFFQRGPGHGTTVIILHNACGIFIISDGYITTIGMDKNMVQYGNSRKVTSWRAKKTFVLGEGSLLVTGAGDHPWIYSVVAHLNCVAHDPTWTAERCARFANHHMISKNVWYPGLSEEQMAKLDAEMVFSRVENGVTSVWYTNADKGVVLEIENDSTYMGNAKWGDDFEKVGFICLGSGLELVNKVMKKAQPDHGRSVQESFLTSLKLMAIATKTKETGGLMQVHHMSKSGYTMSAPQFNASELVPLIAEFGGEPFDESLLDDPSVAEER